MGFSPSQVERYARHLLLKEIGGVGQQRLAHASVAILGLGGLGAPAALYLAAAGVGRLRLIDDDQVSLANLQRQILFATQDIGQAKVLAGAAALERLNPDVRLEARLERLTLANAAGLFASMDVVLDGSDSFASRFAVNAACHKLGLPLVSGAVGRWDGQLSVFASGVRPGAPCYACLVPQGVAEAQACAAVGVVGALTGVIGAGMALEAIKLITKAGEPLIGRVVIYDGLVAGARTVALEADPACPVCALVPAAKRG